MNSDIYVEWKVIQKAFFTLPNFMCAYLFGYLCTCMWLHVHMCMCGYENQSSALGIFLSLSPLPPLPPAGSLISAVDDSFRRTRGQQASGITACPCFTNSRVVGNAATLSFSTCVLVLPTQVIMLA